MTATKFHKALITGLALLGLATAPVVLACDDRNDAEEAYDEMKDEVGDAADEIEDEFDDRT